MIYRSFHKNSLANFINRKIRYSFYKKNQGISEYGIRAFSFGIPLDLLRIPGLIASKRFLEDPMRIFQNIEIYNFKYRLKDYEKKNIGRIASPKILRILLGFS